METLQVNFIHGFLFFHLADVPFGCQNSLLPDAVLRPPLIKSLLNDSVRKRYHDNLRLFPASAPEKFGSDGPLLGENS